MTVASTRAPTKQRGGPALGVAPRAASRLLREEPQPGFLCVHRALRIVHCAATASLAEPAVETDSSGVERLQYRSEGWRWWTWRGHRIHYVVAGEQKQGTPFLLVHGFGACAYHWRYQLSSLSRSHPTYALCLLGYGNSAKPALPYSAELWAELVADFLRDVVGRPALLAGNSIGAIAALGAAYERPDMVAGVALLNAAGSIDTAAAADEEEKAPAATEEETDPLASLKTLFRRLVVQGIFLWTKVRIPIVLRQVYVNQERVDAQLVDSIYQPACDPDAPEAFFHISNAGRLSRRTLPTLLNAAKQHNIPMTLIWGQKDPWMRPEKAAQIMDLYPAATLTNIPEGGHCPHDVRLAYMPVRPQLSSVLTYCRAASFLAHRTAPRRSMRRCCLGQRRWPCERGRHMNAWN